MHELPLQNLGDRTENFARNVRIFIRKLPKEFDLIPDAKQLIRSSGSVGANYLEANEALSRRDQIHRMRIVKKEARESAYWLGLLSFRLDELLLKECAVLIDEAKQLVRIFHSIIAKAKPE